MLPVFPLSFGCGYSLAAPMIAHTSAFFTPIHFSGHFGPVPMSCGHAPSPCAMGRCGGGCGNRCSGGCPGGCNQPRRF